MPFKQFTIAQDTTVTVYKRRGSRSLRLSVTADNRVRVTIPAWAPYSSGVSFAKARLNWIAAHRRTSRLQDGQAIGKAHRLHFVPSAAGNIGSRVKQGDILVRYPDSLSPTDTAVQAAAEKAAIRALRTQAQQLLPQRLQQLAEQHDFSYSAVSVKRLKSRWGSCDQNGNIVLSLFLMQLPWECIDYVLLHELMHTRILKHGPVFWQAMSELLPELARLRKAMRSYQPVLDNPLASQTVP